MTVEPKNWSNLSFRGKNLRMETNFFGGKSCLFYFALLLKYEPSLVENLPFLAFSSDGTFDCKMSASNSDVLSSGTGRVAATWWASPNSGCNGLLFCEVTGVGLFMYACPSPRTCRGLAMYPPSAPPGWCAWVLRSPRPRRSISSMADFAASAFSTFWVACFSATRITSASFWAPSNFRCSSSSLAFAASTCSTQVIKSSSKGSTLT